MNNTHSSGQSLQNSDLQCVFTDSERMQAKSFANICTQANLSLELQSDKQRTVKQSIGKQMQCPAKRDIAENIKSAKFNHIITRAWQANIR